jgi:YD repeat-containing protein
MTHRFVLAGPLVCLSIMLAGSAVAATASYQYDALGRLTEVRYDTGMVAIYKYDAAGNRDKVITGTIPGTPASITVPTSSTTGSYTIRWGASTGTVTAYQLYEATNPSFTGATLLYTGTALSRALSGRLSGRYYYRVRACIDAICSGYQADTIGILVTRP